MAKKMREKGYLALNELNAQELALQKAKFTQEQAQTKKTVLEQYTKDKTIKELKSEVEKARADELAKEATWKLERAKEEKLRQQVKDLRVVAPADGHVRYRHAIRAGRVFRQGDVLFRLIRDERPNAGAK
jgi:HlyD family secretion protein